MRVIEISVCGVGQITQIIDVNIKCACDGNGSRAKQFTHVGIIERARDVGHVCEPIDGIVEPFCFFQLFDHLGDFFRELRLGIGDGGGINDRDTARKSGLRNGHCRKQKGGLEFHGNSFRLAWKMGSH